ncbi:uncharacterized protein with PIN domain [Massilia sp. UYP11]|uniref:Mut7-C RNAse domain-containing protein n=1 Tax=Massilia sp. UYP11 TaxID=1756385 RepID=UPI003D1C5770
MVTATFRFYQELGAFLPRERRGRAFAADCARRSTAKHMIEALGVPHTEVEMVLVNGEPSGFDRMLQEGDHVAVYARFALPAAGPHGGPGLDWLRERARARMRFVADAHLGGLARLLRMAGYDTLYDNHYRDDEIEDLAANDDRIVLTRDRALLKRRAIVHGCYVHALDPPRQLRELFERLDLAGGARPFSLCLHCNLPLRAVAKASVLARLPASVRALHDSFTTCDNCLRVYWKGSHYERMAALLAALGQREKGALDDLADVESPEETDFHL